MLIDTFNTHEIEIIRTMACELLSACACEAAQPLMAVFIAPVADELFRFPKKSWEERCYADEARALAGAAWLHYSMREDYLELDLEERYAECEALIREGWEPRDD